MRRRIAPVRRRVPSVLQHIEGTRLGITQGFHQATAEDSLSRASQDQKIFGMMM